METLRVGFIGTGKKKPRGDALGSFMAYQHADGYRQVPGCRMVACADIVPENAEGFASTYDIPAVYTEYHEMLAKEDLDVVSISTWPGLHAEMVLDCAVAGVRAIHCEKPMAETYGDARLMVQECDRLGVQLTFNHQRRFGLPFRMAKQLLKDGAVGDLVRLEVGAGDLFDSGTHFIDMANYYNDEVPAAWVIAQLDAGTERVIFGTQLETQALCHWQYRNGVHGLFAGGAGAMLVGALVRIVGTEGEIEIGKLPHPNVIMRMRRRGSGEWEEVDTKGEHLHGPGYVERAIADTVAALREGREPELSARRALNVTEIIFACFESARRRGRVDLPLRIDDNPLFDMLASGEIKRA